MIAGVVEGCLGIWVIGRVCLGLGAGAGGDRVEYIKLLDGALIVVIVQLPEFLGDVRKAADLT